MLVNFTNKTNKVGIFYQKQELFLWEDSWVNIISHVIGVINRGQMTFLGKITKKLKKLARCLH